MSEFHKEERVMPSEELKKVKVLYVEDEEMIRESLAMLLRRYVPHLILASNGEEGLECFKNENPDIVVSDIRMPKMDGLDMAREIKHLSPLTPIIITTAFGDSEYLLKGIEIGLNGYLIKPINKNSLFKFLNESARNVLAQKAKERFNRYTQQILDFQQNLVVVIDENLALKRANKSFLDYFGCESLEEFVARYEDWSSLIAVNYDEKGNGAFDVRFLESIIEDKSEGHTLIFHAQGTMTERFFTLSASKLVGEGEWESEYIVSFTDITTFEKENKKLQRQATTDTLTGIDNRFRLQEILGEWEHKSESYSVIFFDIDHFKQINDEFGHDKGDEILIELANLVRQELRSEDIFARLGGEEFVVLLRNAPLERGGEVAERLRQSIECHDFPIGRMVSCSFGVAKNQPYEKPEEAIKRADSAMYLAKRSGRNRVEVDYR